MMTGATLFSGIGAPEASAPWIDWLWSADIDEFANAVRAYHWPDTPNLGDVAEIDGDAVERPDVIVFGSPCQSFSVAGKRLGLDDPRGNLALVALRLVQRIRPRWFVFENVPGLFSSFSGAEQEEGEVREGAVGGCRDGEEDRDFAAFLTRIRQCGYSGAWRVLDARYAGTPQRRRRIFFVGCAGDDWRPPAAVLFESESLRGHPAPGREAGEDVARGPDESARNRRKTVGALNTANNKTRPGDTLQCAQLGHMIAYGGNNTSGPIDVAAGLNNKSTQRQDFESETLIAVATPATVRRLTPTECERLQGFPDGFTDISWKGKRAPDGRRYAALGNSMAVPVIGWVLERIRMYEPAAPWIGETGGALPNDKAASLMGCRAAIRPTAWQSRALGRR